VNNWASTFAFKIQRIVSLRRGYCDGAAHQRKDAFRASLYDTGVFVLQSSKAASSAVGRHVAAGPKSGGAGKIGRFEVGLALFTTLFCSHNTVQLMTAIMVHVSNLTPGSDNHNTVQLMTASMVNVNNLTPPGSDNPRSRRR
jgi:hypothetical protein